MYLLTYLLTSPLPTVWNCLRVTFVNRRANMTGLDDYLGYFIIVVIVVSVYSKIYNTEKQAGRRLDVRA